MTAVSARAPLQGYLSALRDKFFLCAWVISYATILWVFGLLKSLEAKRTSGTLQD